MNTVTNCQSPAARRALEPLKRKQSEAQIPCKNFNHPPRSGQVSTYKNRLAGVSMPGHTTVSDLSTSKKGVNSSC